MWQRAYEEIPRNCSKKCCLHIEASCGWIYWTNEDMGGWVNSEASSEVSMCSLMTDKCIDVSTVEELFVFCCLEEDGVPIQCVLDIIPLK